MSEIGVIIPNYNGANLLRGALRSLQGQSIDNFRIVVVDDGSTEPGIDDIARDYKSVQVIKRSKNGGFAAAVNDGIRATADCKYVILLNNDTIVAYEFVEELYKSIQAKPDAFSVQARLISNSNKNVLDDAGDFYNLWGYAYARGKGKNVIKYCAPSGVFSACGGAAIFRREVFAKIGIFDEKFFAYLEDVDIGYRALLYGYKNYYEPRAVVYHIGSATSGSVHNAFKVKLAARNSIYVYYKNQPAWQRFLLFIPHLLGRGIKRIYFKKLGLADAYDAGVKEGLANRKTLEKVTFKEGRGGRAFLIGFTLFVNCFRQLG